MPRLLRVTASPMQSFCYSETIKSSFPWLFIVRHIHSMYKRTTCGQFEVSYKNTLYKSAVILLLYLGL